MSSERSVSKATHDSLRTIVDVGEQHRQLKDLVVQLSRPELQRAVAENTLTFGLVRPQLHDPTERNRPRRALLEELFTMICLPLQVMYHAPLALDDKAIEDLWAGYSRSSLQSKQPLFADGGTRWDEFKRFMLSGESEILLLRTAQPGAVQAWREQMGPTWEVSKLRKRVQDHLAARFTPFRARYAPEDPKRAILNNGFHGSSSSEDVARELEVIRQCAQRALAEQQASTS